MKPNYKLKKTMRHHRKPWENHRGTIGNHRETIGKPSENHGPDIGIERDLRFSEAHQALKTV